MKNLDAIWKKPLNNQQGFTLVEMGVAVVVAIILMIGVTAVFISHSNHYIQQDELSVLQQDLRSLLMVVTADIRLAGCDPLEKGKARITKATEHAFNFSADIASKKNSKYPNESDGEVDAPGEEVGYKFEDGKLSRNVRGETRMTGWQPIIEHIERLEFNYIIQDDKGNMTATTKPTRSQINKKQIKAVQLSVLARSLNPVNPVKGDYRHAGKFTAGSGATWEVPQDGHRRRLVVTTIRLRNMAY